MGLLDRFKKAPGPDALTWEAVARARAVSGVEGADAVDADTVTVTWLEHPGTTTLSLEDVREEWTKASGFARIELMDQVVAGLAPPPAGSEAAQPEPTPEPAPAPPPPTPRSPEPEPSSTPDAWLAARSRLALVVDRADRAPAAVRWLIGAGLEARAVLDATDGPPVGDDDLAAWGVDAEAVRTTLLAGLAAADPGLDPIGPGQPAWVPTVPESHPPLWLAAPGRLLEACGLTEAIALAPMPTELVVVDPAATEVLASVLSGTRAILAEQPGERLLAAPLLVRADGVEVWQPGADHPCASLVEELHAAG